jgi:hypothetical protein
MFFVWLSFVFSLLSVVICVCTMCSFCNWSTDCWLGTSTNKNRIIIIIISTDVTAVQLVFKECRSLTKSFLFIILLNVSNIIIIYRRNIYYCCNSRHHTIQSNVAVATVVTMSIFTLEATSLKPHVVFGCSDTFLAIFLCPSRENAGWYNKLGRDRFNSGAHPKKGGCQAAPPQTPPKPKFKKHRFCSYYDIKSYTWFTLKPKSVTKISWWLVR